MRSSLSFGVCVAMVLGAAACGSSLPTQNKQMTSAVVGPSGGMLASSDGALQVAIPAGALPSNVTVTIVPTTRPGSGAIGTTYELGPTGTQFAMPVTLTFDYGATSLGGVDPSLLRVATFAAGSWRLLSGASFDTQARTVSGTTTHLSPYGLTSAAAGAMCATVAGGVSCSGGTDPGSGSGTAGTTGAADMTGGVASGGTTGGATVSCTPSTCADATDACAAYPGAAMTGCTDGPNGYMATCCFPAGGSICLQAVGGGSGCAVDCAAGGSCTTTCPPPPTCADATAASACGGLAGATLQSCVDGPSGYAAACCFAPGAPVCATVGAGRACGGSTNGTTTCAPAPTCADGDPCAGLAGATVQSCTDSADGYTAVCCLPVGEVPSRGGVTSSGGGAGGASSGGSGTAGVDGSSSGAGGGIDPTGSSGGVTGAGAGGSTTGAGAGGGTTGAGAAGGTTGSGGAPTGTGGTTSAGGTTAGGGVPG